MMPSSIFLVLLPMMFCKLVDSKFTKLKLDKEEHITIAVGGSHDYLIDFDQPEDGEELQWWCFSSSLVEGTHVDIFLR